MSTSEPKRHWIEERVADAVYYPSSDLLDISIEVEVHGGDFVDAGVTLNRAQRLALIEFLQSVTP